MRPARLLSVDLGGTVDAGGKRQVRVVFGIDGAAVTLKLTIKRVIAEEEVRMHAEAACEEDEIGTLRFV